MKHEKEYSCIGIKRLGLVPGQEIRVLEGIKTETPPKRVTVVREYPTWVQLDLEFARSLWSRDGFHILTGVHKGAMLCGDVKLKLVPQGTVLTGSEVGIYGWV